MNTNKVDNGIKGLIPMPAEALREFNLTPQAVGCI